MSIVGKFTKDDVPEWKTGVYRWCIIEVTICTAWIVALNVLEFLKRK
jgi:hypothetical protein